MKDPLAAGFDASLKQIFDKTKNLGEAMNVFSDAFDTQCHDRVKTYPLNGKVRPLGDDNVDPGSLVVWRSQHASTMGLAVSVTPTAVTVVWSKQPRDSGLFSKVQFFKPTPMQVPKSNLFFLDYEYEGKKTGADDV